MTQLTHRAQRLFKDTYPGGFVPELWTFDTNCLVAQMVAKDPFFDNISLIVDVFHFTCKHSKSHEFCQQNCNPALYPEMLKDDGKGWFFNTSIAEQNNVWLAGFNSILREMKIDRYNFFLDEMIMLRNADLLLELEAKGANPGIWTTKLLGVPP